MKPYFKLMFWVNPKNDGFFFVKQQFVKYGLKEEKGSSSFQTTLLWEARPPASATGLLESVGSHDC